MTTCQRRKFVKKEIKIIAICERMKRAPDFVKGAYLCSLHASGYNLFWTLQERQKRRTGCCPILVTINLLLTLSLRNTHIYYVLRNSVPLLKACNFTKSSTPPWVFFTFFEWYKLHQIAHGIGTGKWEHWQEIG